MIVVALTGSIAMGKSETAKMFAARGIPVFDSDAAVHELYASGGRAVEPIRSIAPEAITGEAVDRRKLSALVAERPDLLKKVEAVVHPLVRESQQNFLERARAGGARIALLDIPLLFETGAEKRVDAVVVVSATAEIQRNRALARPGMTEEKLDFILSLQVSDAEKRRRADFVIDTSTTLQDASHQVDAVIAALENRNKKS